MTHPHFIGVFRNLDFLPSQTGVADELTKLAALYKDNLLTQAEYESQKKKILS
ncbi:SHOCT domain-containing protein [Bacillus velezensis]|uniref:SHOCT domain-containing protein n=1 Tax=Bacillus velezensis TaxID=492670 RepID=UPI003392ACD7